MNPNKDFSECLNELMRAADLKNSKLAKAINVDASLIYKWLNNKSIPPYNSQHIDLIVNQVIKNTNNSYQSKNITDFIRKNLAGHEINENNKLELLRKLLIESQGYSIEKKKKIKNKAINAQVHTMGNKPFVSTSNTSQGSHAISQDTFSNVQIISGHEVVFSTALQLLETASAANFISSEPIMITLLTEMNKLPCYPAFNNKWRDILCKLTQKGWSIIYLVHIDNNNTRNLKIIEDMLVPISTGKYQVYYTNGNDYVLPFEIVFVPRVGSLFCVPSMDRHQVDSAFLLKSKEALNIASGYFYQLLASSKPLLKSCLPLEYIGFQKYYYKVEEILGNKYSLLRELSTLSIPITLYENNLQKSKLPKEERLHKFSYHKQRIKAFESQVKHYKFREIIYDECLINLIERKKYSHLDKYYTFDDMTITNDDLIKHLSNIIYLLKKYENFEIGLANKKLLSSIPVTNWIVKENSAVAIITCAPEISAHHENDELINTSRGFIVSELNIIKAFECYFHSLWNQIQPDKKEVISQFESFISLLE